MNISQSVIQQNLLPIKSASLRFSIAHALLGAILGYVLIHPIALIIILYGSGKPWYAIYGSAFTLGHLPMGMYFTLLGLGIGGMNGALHTLIARLERQVETLMSILPICASCKKLRMQKDNNGEERWMTVEEYLATEHDQKLTHTICRECARRLYPELDLPR